MPRGRGCGISGSALIRVIQIPDRDPTGRDFVIFAIAIAPMAVYVYGSVALGWGFNELSGAFLIAGCVAGLLGGLGAGGTTTAYLEGMQAMLPAAMLIGVARSISLVLDRRPRHRHDPERRLRRRSRARRRRSRRC